MAKEDKKMNAPAEPEESDKTVVFSKVQEDVVFREDETPEERLLSRKDFRKAAFSLVSAVVLFAASIIIWAFRDKFDPDRFIVLSADKAAVAKEEYAFDAGSAQVFAIAGHGLAAATPSGFELMDGDGTVAVSHLYRMESPAIAAGNDFAVFYDLGGQSMAVASYDGSIREIEPAGNIISVTVSAGGYIAVTTDCTGYRALVTVYDTTFEPVYEWYSSSAWIISGEVSPDNRSLAVLSYTASGSEVRFFDLSKTEQQAAFSVSDTVLLDIHWFSSTQLCAYSTGQAIFFDHRGQWSSTYSFDSQYLIHCTFGGDNCVTFALSPYRAGTTSGLVSLDANGKVLGKTNIQSEIISLTASGSEVLVLCPDGAILLTSSLSEKGQLAGLTGFKYGILRSRGEALLVSSNYAEVYTF